MRLLSGLLLGGAVLGLGLCFMGGASQGGADSPAKKAKPVAPGTEKKESAATEKGFPGEKKGKRDLGEVIPQIPLDEGFGPYCDVEMLCAAARDVDSVGLTDAALRQMVGERVLLRPHGAFPAAVLMEIAIRAAVANKDKASLERLAKAAEQLSDKALQARTNTARKLVAQERAEDASGKVSVTRVTPASFATYRSLLRKIRLAKVSGDKLSIPKLEARINNFRALTPEQREELKKQLQTIVDNLPEKQDKSQELLARLAAASRDDGDGGDGDNGGTDPDQGGGDGGGIDPNQGGGDNGNGCQPTQGGSCPDNCGGGNYCPPCWQPPSNPPPCPMMPAPQPSTRPFHNFNPSIGPRISIGGFQTNARQHFRPPSHAGGGSSNLYHGRRDIGSEEEDLAFASYVTADEVAEACDRVDPALLTDVALRLGEGERVLCRQHQGGVTSGMLLQKAAALAGERNDKETLGRLKNYAEKVENKDLLVKVQSAQKLGSAGRGIELGLKLPETTSLEFVSRLQNLIAGIRQAEVRGDARSLEMLADEVEQAADLTAAEKDMIRQYIGRVRPSLPPILDPNVLLLRKLEAPERSAVQKTGSDEVFEVIVRNPTPMPLFYKLNGRSRSVLPAGMQRTHRGTGTAVIAFDVGAGDRSQRAYTLESGKSYQFRWKQEPHGERGTIMAVDMIGD
jgi:hypothetical protein